MSNIDTFGEYVEFRLKHWGDEFSLSRRCEYLGYASKNLLAVLMEHHEMPGRVTGYKPLEVDVEAMQIEDIVAEIARDQMAIACVMRAWYCGRGRRKVEKFETANMLIANARGQPVSLSQYRNLHIVGEAQVRGALIGIAQAA